MTDLYQCFPEEWHHICRVHTTKTAYGAYSQLSYLKYFIVKHHKQGRQILSLRQVWVKSLIQGHQHTVPNIRVCKKNIFSILLFNYVLKFLIFLKFHVSPKHPSGHWHIVTKKMDTDIKISTTTAKSVMFFLNVIKCKGKTIELGTNKKYFLTCVCNAYNQKLVEYICDSIHSCGTHMAMLISQQLKLICNRFTAFYRLSVKLYANF